MPATGIGLSAEDFIRQRLVLTPLSFRPDISLFRPTATSGLAGWLATQDRADEPPYWAYGWAGGAVLACYLAEYPDLVAGRRVLDFGAGGGLVAIAAALAGASVTAFEADPIGRAAIAVNAEANGVRIAVSDCIVPAEIVLAGDVFYDEDVAAKTLPALLELAANGAMVLIGDPYRRALPLDRLDCLYEHAVPDFGSDRPVRAGVFALRTAEARR